MTSNLFQAQLTPSTLSALPILAPLQRWLAELSISPPPAAKPSLVLEVGEKSDTFLSFIFLCT